MGGKNLIRQQSAQPGTQKFGAHARKMFIDGGLVKADFTEQEKPAAAVSKAVALPGGWPYIVQAISHIVCHR